MDLLRRTRRRPPLPPVLPPLGHAIATGRIDAALAIHLRSVGGRSSHATLVEWAALHGWAPEDLDRCLVRGCRGDALRVELGEPACTATRQVALNRRL
jgi:hypothetical protein